MSALSNLLEKLISRDPGKALLAAQDMNQAQQILEKGNFSQQNTPQIVGDLLKRAGALQKTDPERAIFLCKVGILVGEHVSDARLQIHSLCRLGYIYEKHIYSNKLAMQAYTGVIQLAEKQSWLATQVFTEVQANLIGEAHYRLGRLFLEDQQYTEASQHLQHSINLFSAFDQPHKAQIAQTMLDGIQAAHGSPSADALSRGAIDEPLTNITGAHTVSEPGKVTIDHKVELLHPELPMPDQHAADYIKKPDLATIRLSEVLSSEKETGASHGVDNLLEGKITEEFRIIIQRIETTRDWLFVTGPAGCGKSTVLRALVETTKRNFVLLAPTGVAALNVGGQTIHKFFKFPARFLDKSRIVRVRNPGIYEALDLIIFDEISMVRVDMIDNIDLFMRLNGKDKTKPFGGAQVVFFGDLCQLPPVVDPGPTKDYINQHYASEFFFAAHVFDIVPLHIELLSKIFRQNDPEFIQILNRVRVGSVSENDLLILNNSVNRSFAPPDGTFFITLTANNDIAAKVNSEKINDLPTHEFVFRGEVSGEFPTNDLPTDMELHLKEGAQVMFIKNHPDGFWVNGTLGKIIGLNQDYIRVMVNGKIFDVDRESWETIKYTYNEAEDKIISEVAGTFIQYPLKLAWAITIHKSQGLTLENVIIDLGRGAFLHGQTYVALSRCKSLGGIVLRQPLTFHDIRVDRKVMDFLRENLPQDDDPI